jgi:hypothetical protein
MNLEITPALLSSLKLNPNGEYQVLPVVEHCVIAVAPGGTVATSYTAFSNTTRLPEAYQSTIFPNDNAYIFSEIQMRSDAVFAALGTSSTQQTQDYFERRSRLVIKQDTTLLLSLSMYEASVAQRYTEDTTLVTAAREYDFYSLPTPLQLAVRDNVRFQFDPAGGGLQLAASTSGANPYLYQYDGTNSSFYTLLELKLKGVQLIPR